MRSRTAACPQLNLVLRQTEEAPPDCSPPATHWFYIVDPDGTDAGGSRALEGRGAVLGLSSNDADAQAAARDGLGVIYYAELGEREQQAMTARIVGSALSADGT
jgi:hypothetical protein